MSLVQQAGSRRLSLRGRSLASRSAGIRLRVDTLVFALAFGFTVAVILGLIP